MAKTKATGSTRLGRDSQPKYLGVKLFEGQNVNPGQVIIKQRGTKFIPGKNVRKGNDDTLYAAKKGIISFAKKRKTNFDGSQRIATIVNIF